MNENKIKSAVSSVLDRPDNDMTFRDDPQKAFAEAIEQGRLSTDPTADNYAGNYMYMCTVDGKDLFKNSLTRRYDV